MRDEFVSYMQHLKSTGHNIAMEARTLRRERVFHKRDTVAASPPKRKKTMYKYTKHMLNYEKHV